MRAENQSDSHTHVAAIGFRNACQCLSLSATAAHNNLRAGWPAVLLPLASLKAVSAVGGHSRAPLKTLEPNHRVWPLPFVTLKPERCGSSLLPSDWLELCCGLGSRSLRSTLGRFLGVDSRGPQ